MVNEIMRGVNHSQYGFQCYTYWELHPKRRARLSESVSCNTNRLTGPASSLGTFFSLSKSDTSSR
eukprot:1322735-Prymnesium_polylepis.2